MQTNKSRTQNSQTTKNDQSEYDPIALLTHQHREIDTLFEEIESSAAKAYRRKEKVAHEIATKLLFHTKLEQKIFYPQAHEVDPDIVMESLEEHEVIKNEIKRVLATSANEASFNAKINVLKELIHHHVKEEENVMFPSMREKCARVDLMKIGGKLAMAIKNHQNLHLTRTSSRHVRAKTA